LPARLTGTDECVGLVAAGWWRPQLARATWRSFALARPSGPICHQGSVIERAWTFLEATQIILGAGDSIRIVEAWWLGKNPDLGGREPALVLAEGGAEA